MKKLTKILLATIIGLAFAFSSYGQETVYVIANINANPTPIQSFGVTGNTLGYQATGNVPYHGYGAVSLAMDEVNGVLFVCYENSSIIEMVNATNMQVLGSTTAPSASTISGIAYDPTTLKLYANNRSTNRFYKWSWDFSTTTLTNDYGTPGYILLPGVIEIMDIALDHVHGILYCSDNYGSNTNITYYNTADFTTLAGTYTVGHNPLGIDVDINNQILYTTNYGNTLSKYVIGTGETLLPFTLATGLMGVEVNQSSGIVYCTNRYGTYGDQLLVIDPASGAITWNSGDIGDPSGLLYTGQGFNPLDLDITTSPAEYRFGQYFTFNISYQNNNSTPVTGVQLTSVVPSNVTIVSQSSKSPTGTATWNIGNLAPGQGGIKTLTVMVNSGDSFTNVITINSNETGIVTKNHVSQRNTSPPGVPLSDWAIYFAVLLIGIAIWFRFKTHIA